MNMEELFGDVRDIKGNPAAYRFNFIEFSEDKEEGKCFEFREQIDVNIFIKAKISRVVNIVLRHCGKDKVKSFLARTITEIDPANWEENVLIHLFCVNTHIDTKTYVDILEALLATREYTEYLITYHAETFAKFESILLETPLKFNVLEGYLLAAIKAIEAQQLEEMIKKQREYDEMMAYSKNYLEY